MEAGKGRVQKSTRVGRRDQAAVKQELRGDGREAQVGREPVDGGGVVRQQAPGFGKSG
jgi:hypothetical protein